MQNRYWWKSVEIAHQKSRKVVAYDEILRAGNELIHCLNSDKKDLYKNKAHEESVKVSSCQKVGIDSQG